METRQTKAERVLSSVAQHVRNHLKNALLAKGFSNPTNKKKEIIYDLTT